MALQSPFFGKREAEPLNPRPTPPAGSSSMALPSSASASTSSAGSSPLSGASTTADSRAATAAAVTSAAAEAAAPSASKLTVGPNIKLKGVEITDCDTLVVEGLVEATMDSRVMVVEEQGAFKGSAQVDFAEIRGRFEGTLNARTRLVIRATGKVTGNVRYGSVVIEEGGQLGGEVHFAAAGGTGAPASGASSSGSASASSASHDDSAGS